MGYVLLSESFPTARKTHRCIWCGQLIVAGEKYRSERSVSDGDMQYHKWHLECDEAFAAEVTAEGGGPLEFAPHDNERPESTRECHG